MELPNKRTIEPLPIDAQLIELPKRQVVVLRPKKQTAVRSEAPRRSQENPGADHSQPTVNANANTMVPAISLPARTHDTSFNGYATGASIFTNSGARAPSQNGQSGTGTNILANMGARAIVRPMPQIPDDLREVAFNSVALAHFHIAVDGRVTVELVRPTPNPRLNRILLENLKKWRFAPAIKAGQSVESTEEIDIRIEVK